ncbi:MAG: Na+/H+ antiporter subunit E [Desulfobacterota bacterium]|nr:Na+/H+ antiporter subunit E [Thermodesulfobacteriota bacterium]
MKRPKKREGFLLTFLVMFFFWVILSGLFGAFHLIAGLFSSALVALLSHDLLVQGKAEKLLTKSWRLIRYIPWELWQIVLANFDVAYRVLHPKLPIDPRIFEFETDLRGDWALTTLANSITLTPGTITIQVEPERGRFLVHGISKEAEEALTLEQTMQRKVGHVFMEPSIKKGDRG